jgi:hypothetical protein
MDGHDDHLFGNRLSYTPSAYIRVIRPLTFSSLTSIYEWHLTDVKRAKKAPQAEPPLRWPAGADAVETFEKKARELLAQANAHRALSSSLAHDDGN